MYLFIITGIWYFCFKKILLSFLPSFLSYLPILLQELEDLALLVGLETKWRRFTLEVAAGLLADSTSPLALPPSLPFFCYPFMTLFLLCSFIVLNRTLFIVLLFSSVLFTHLLNFLPFHCSCHLCPWQDR